MNRSKFIVMSMMMWFLASFFYAYQYILRVLPNVMMDELLLKFQIDAEIFGQLNGIYYIGYAGMHIPIGWLLDRFGPKYILPLCMALCAGGLLPFIYADAWVYPCLGRFMIGVGSSAAILGVFKIIRICFKEEHFTRMLGISVTIGLLGAIYGGWPIHWMIHHMGWAQTFKGLAVFGLITAVITFVVVPKTDKNTSPIWADLKALMKNHKIIFICLLAGLMVGPLEGFADGWSTGFLERVYHLDTAMSASIPSMIFIGMCVGSPLLSMVGEKTNAYFEVIALSALGMGLFMIALLSGQVPTSLIGVCFFIIGMLCAYQILAIYKASTYAHQSAVGLTTAMANMIIMMFGYLFHTGVGKLMVGLWDKTVVDGIPYYNENTFVWALSLIPITLMVGFLGFAYLAIREPKLLANQTPVSEV